MILVDTSMIVAWLDPNHPEHEACLRALDGCAAVDELAISVLTLAELVSTGRNSSLLEEDLRGFVQLPIGSSVAIRAGRSLVRHLASKSKKRISFTSFLIWSLAAELKAPVLTREERPAFAADVDVFMPETCPPPGVSQRR